MVASASFNLRGLGALIERMKKLDGTEVEVGFFSEDRYGPDNDNLPVATVAAYNEFGTRFNPTRPFMSDTFRDMSNRRLIEKGVRDVAVAAIKDGRSVQRLLKALGSMIGEMIEKSIEDWPGSNSLSTIEKKGFNDPLFDTGVMLKSVKFEIH